MSRFRLLIVGLLLTAAPLHTVFAGTLSVVGPDRWAHVAYVYGVDDGTRVRLLGTNAPDVAHHDAPGQPLGEKAGRRMRDLILGREARLQTDEVHHDAYGRLLAHIYRRDGTWIDGVLVSEWLAHVYIFPPNFRHAAALLKDEDKARAQKLGIWAVPRFQVLTAAEVTRSLVGQFRVIEGRVDHVAKNGLAFRMGRLHVSIPRAYRRYFPRRLNLATGSHVRVRGVLRLSDRGRLYLALHSPFELTKIISP